MAEQSINSEVKPAGGGMASKVIVYDKVRGQLLFSQRRTLKERLRSRKFVFVFLTLTFLFQAFNIWNVSHITHNHYPRPHTDETYYKHHHYHHHARPDASNYSESITALPDEYVVSDTAPTRNTGFAFWFVLGYLVFIGALLTKAYGPGRIIVTDEGIRFRWVNIYTTSCIPWSIISNVSTSNIARLPFVKSAQQFNYTSRSIELNIPRSATDLLRYLALKVIAMCLPDGTIANIRKSKVILKLDSRAIVHDEDRFEFIRMLESKLGSDMIDPDLLGLCDAGGDGHISGFTKVWLDDFEKQKRGLDPLKTNDVLAGGEYQIVDQLAVGGQALTYRAIRIPVQSQKSDNQESPNLAQEQQDQGSILKLPPEDLVVLKEFVLPERGGNKVRQRALANIDHEAMLLRQLNHPQVVKLLDSFVQGHRAYLVMEKVEGQSLRSLVQRDGAFSNFKVQELALQMCKVLRYLHEQNPPIIHQDFTPDNLLLKPDGQLVLIDFNVAEQLEQECTKTVVGKHCYMPPEQFRGHPSTQSDIYAMGATLYFLLTGNDPEPISTSHPSSVNSIVSDLLNSVVAKATAIDTTKRYTAAAEIEKDLALAVAV